MTQSHSLVALSPVEIFLGADRVVQGVMVLLALVSIASWSIIASRLWAMLQERRIVWASKRALTTINSEDDLATLCELANGGISRIMTAVEAEWRWSSTSAWSRGRSKSDASLFTLPPQRPYEPVRARLLTVAELAIAVESRGLAARSAWLGTIGSVTPFVGLFGTVWGIMSSFLAIGQTEDTSLAVVAPGIAEALMATAVGLACAIPAVIAYNRLLQGVAEIETDWRLIVGQLEVAISRHFHESAA